MSVQAVETVAVKSDPAPVVSFAPKRFNWFGAVRIALPLLAAVCTWAMHQYVPAKGLGIPTQSSAYPILLAGLIALGLAMMLVPIGAALFRRWLRPQVVHGAWWHRALQSGGRHLLAWDRHQAPLVAAGILLLCLWELLTSKWALLSHLYFPGPAAVLNSMIQYREQLFDCTWHSLLLLSCGYLTGMIAGIVCGVMIGWSSNARYWGMPVLKIIGPIPATAWLPFALLLFPSTFLSAASILAAAVWFPVTMLTASGISNVRVSYLDVARTLGARPRFLIFRVAIPAAMPSIFLGLFMGLGASFLTLVVAEKLGVQSGLCWYMDWARENMDYARVYAALILMAAFFSLIISGLFKLRDWALVWQRGVIKW